MISLMKSLGRNTQVQQSEDLDSEKSDDEERMATMMTIFLDEANHYKPPFSRRNSPQIVLIGIAIELCRLVSSKMWLPLGFWTS
ncbi:hypothetical protein N7454_005478 [Penicillium verhagenii]|nr:hypothetical protein N7454_005478 [Penicillium verhagenii]